MVHAMMKALLFTFPINNYVKAFNLAFHQVMNGIKCSERSSKHQSCFPFCGMATSRKAGDNEVVEWMTLIYDNVREERQSLLYCSGKCFSMH